MGCLNRKLTLNISKNELTIFSPSSLPLSSLPPFFFNLIPSTLGYLLLQHTALENRHAIMNKAVTIPALVSYMLVRHIQQKNYRNNYIKIDLMSVMKESSEFNTSKYRASEMETWLGLGVLGSIVDANPDLRREGQGGNGESFKQR